MNILHIASIDNNTLNGVPHAVPIIINAQLEAGSDDIAFLNVRDVEIEGLDCQLFPRKLSIDELVYPFNEPDLVVFHEVYYPKFLKIYKDLKKAGIPYVIVPHGCLTAEAQNIKKWKKRIGNELLFKHFVMDAAALQFLSPAEKKRTIFKKEGFTAPCGIKLPEKYKIYEKILGTAEKGFVNEAAKQDFAKKPVRFTYIGRIDTHIKGLDLLLKAIDGEQKYLRKNSCEFVLYGPDENGSREELEDLAIDLGIADLVSINDPVTEEEKVEVLLSSDVFLQFSRSEALSSGLLEALSYGLPCVVSCGTGLAGLINRYDAGLGSSNKEDVRELSGLLFDMVDSKEDFPEMSRNARKLIEDNFEQHRCSSYTLQKYRMLLCD